MPPEWLVELDELDGRDGVSIAFCELDELLEARIGAPIRGRDPADD
jgi:hypothetical protein